MYEIQAKYVGVVPMMMHRFADPTQTEKPAKKKAKGRNEADIKAALHVDKKGVFVPADNIRMMLIGNKHRQGAAKIQGSYIEKGKGTEYLNMVKSCIWVLGPDDPQKVYLEPNRRTHDDVDARSFINAAGSRSMAYRPILTLPWSLSFTIQVVDDNIDESKVRQFFDVAGLRCGVCAYGPTFGRCVIEQWQVNGT
jgi:hypothetical protein